MSSKKSKIIGFDLDDVLLNFNDNLYLYHNNVYGTNYKRKYITSHNLSLIWQCTQKEATKKLDDFYYSQPHFDALPVEGAVEGVKALDKNHRLFIVTSRPKEIREMTLRWLDLHFPNMFNDVYFINHFQGTGKKRTKGEICRELGVQVFVDDVLEYAQTISDAGIPVLLYDTPWNQGETGSLMTRVYSWPEIVSKLNSDEY